MLHVPGEDGEANGGDRTYLILAKPNVIMNDGGRPGLAVASRDAAGRPEEPTPSRIR